MKHLSFSLSGCFPFCSQFLSRGCAAPRDLGMSFRRGEHKIRTKSQFTAKRFTGDIKENKDKKCKNGRVSSLLYHISKLTIPFLCPHKILSSSYAMFVLLYPLYYLYLTNCNTLVRNNKRSLPLLLYFIVSLMLKHDHVQVDENRNSTTGGVRKRRLDAERSTSIADQSSFVRD